MAKLKTTQLDKLDPVFEGDTDLIQSRKCEKCKLATSRSKIVPTKASQLATKKPFWYTTKPTSRPTTTTSTTTTTTRTLKKTTKPTTTTKKTEKEQCDLIVPYYRRSTLINQKWPVETYPKTQQDCQDYTFYASGVELDYCGCIDLINTTYDDMTEYLKGRGTLSRSSQT